jgi:spore coat protein CotH
VAALAALGLLSGCTAASATDEDAATGTGLFDSSEVHSIAVEYDQDDYDAMIDTYLETGEKDWITATVTIDGTTIEDVGLKLKGNSTLRGLTAATTEDGDDDGDESDGDASADDPAGLPWRIRLDKYVDGQSYEGQTDLVVRGNSTETSARSSTRRTSTATGSSTRRCPPATGPTAATTPPTTPTPSRSRPPATARTT